MLSSTALTLCTLLSCSALLQCTGGTGRQVISPVASVLSWYLLAALLLVWSVSPILSTPQCSWISHQQVRSSARPRGVAEPTPSCWRRSYLETWRGSVTRRAAHRRKLLRSSRPKKRRWEGGPNCGSGSQRRTLKSNLRIRTEGRTVWWSLGWNMWRSNVVGLTLSFLPHSWSSGSNTQVSIFIINIMKQMIPNAQTDNVWVLRFISTSS